MRALLIALVALVGSNVAQAADFGVSWDSFKQSLAGANLGLGDLGCKTEFCWLGDAAEKQWVFTDRDATSSLRRVLFRLPVETWAESAAVLDAAQVALRVEQGGRVNSQEIFRAAKTLPYAGLTFKGRAITCSVIAPKDKPSEVHGICEPL